MALDTAGLKSSILSLLTDMEDKDTDAKAEFATRLSAMIETYVKTGVVTVQAGIPVSTTGTAVSQTGVTTSSGTGAIS